MAETTEKAVWVAAVECKGSPRVGDNSECVRLGHIPCGGTGAKYPEVRVSCPKDRDTRNFHAMAGMLATTEEERNEKPPCCDGINYTVSTAEGPWLEALASVRPVVLWSGTLPATKGQWFTYAVKDGSPTPYDALVAAVWEWEQVKERDAN